MTALGFGCLAHPSGGARLRQAVTPRSAVRLSFCSTLSSNTCADTHKRMHTPLLLQLFTLEMSQSNVEQIPIKTSAQWNFNERAHFCGIWGTQLRKSVSHPWSTHANHKPSASSWHTCARAICARNVARESWESEKANVCTIKDKLQKS